MNSRESERAIGVAAGLFSFFLTIKGCLLAWNLMVRHRSPLADLPADGILYLAGSDLLLCLVIALVWFALLRFARLGRPAAGLSRTAAVLVYLGIVIFCISSFQVARIYGDPLSVELLRSADNLLVLRGSLWAYVGPMPLALLLYGLVCAPLLARWIASKLSRRRWLGRPAELWLAVSAVCLLTAFMQRSRLHHIDTFGVKDNAVVYFIKEYKPAFSTIDAPARCMLLEARLGNSTDRTSPPRSLLIANPLPRDFDYHGAGANGFNVVVIQMESTGALHVDAKTAPSIMALAQCGLSFKRHSTVATQTRPATYGLYYSDYLPDLGTTPDLVYGGPMPQPALAEVLKRAGYRTAVFETGFLDYLSIRYMFQDKGADTVVGAREMVQSGAPLAYCAGVHEERTVEELCQWIRAGRGQKFFATYLTEFPHHPYMSMAKDDPFPADSWLNRYLNSLHYADEAVGKLIAFLRSEGLLEKTLVVIVGDHGETVASYPVGHGLAVSVEEMRTPFILSNPVLFPQPLQSRLSSSHLDVAPTIVRLLGLNAPGEWLGRDLLEEKIPPVIQFVNVTYIHRTCLVDNGLLYVLEQGSGHEHMYEIGETALTPLIAGDARLKLMQQYRHHADWYADWSVWRHLKRAQDRTTQLTRLDLIAHQPSPATDQIDAVHATPN